MDQCLIRAIRYSIGKYILKHGNDNIYGITLSNAILPSYPNCR